MRDRTTFCSSGPGVVQERHTGTLTSGPCGSRPSRRGPLSSRSRMEKSAVQEIARKAMKGLRGAAVRDGAAKQQTRIAKDPAQPGRAPGTLI